MPQNDTDGSDEKRADQARDRHAARLLRHRRWHPVSVRVARIPGRWARRSRRLTVRWMLRIGWRLAVRRLLATRGLLAVGRRLLGIARRRIRRIRLLRITLIGIHGHGKLSSLCGRATADLLPNPSWAGAAKPCCRPWRLPHECTLERRFHYTGCVHGPVYGMCFVESRTRLYVGWGAVCCIACGRRVSYKWEVRERQPARARCASRLPAAVLPGAISSVCGDVYLIKRRA